MTLQNGSQRLNWLVSLVWHIRPRCIGGAVVFTTGVPLVKPVKIRVSLNPKHHHASAPHQPVVIVAATDGLSARRHHPWHAPPDIISALSIVSGASVCRTNARVASSIIAHQAWASARRREGSSNTSSLSEVKDIVRAVTRRIPLTVGQDFK